MLLRDGHAHEPELGHLRDNLGGPAAALVELRGLGRDLPRREVAGGVADHALFVGELEVHGAGNLAADLERASSTRPRTSPARARRRGLGAHGDTHPRLATSGTSKALSPNAASRAGAADALAQAPNLTGPVRDGAVDVRQQPALAPEGKSGDDVRLVEAGPRAGLAHDSDGRGADEEDSMSGGARPVEDAVQLAVEALGQTDPLDHVAREGQQASLSVQPAKHQAMSSQMRSSG